MAAPKHVSGTLVNMKSFAGKLAIENEASKHSHEALQVLLEIMHDADQPALARLKSVETLLAYAHGKPVDRIALSAVTSTNDTTQYNLLSTRELLQLVAGNIRQPIESTADTQDVSGD